MKQQSGGFARANCSSACLTSRFSRCKLAHTTVLKDLFFSSAAIALVSSRLWATPGGSFFGEDHRFESSAEHGSESGPNASSRDRKAHPDNSPGSAKFAFQPSASDFDGD